MNSIALAFMLLMGISMLVLPRRYALVPLLITVCYITLGQRFVIIGLDFTIFRIIILFGIVRLIIRKEYSLITLNTIDKTIVLWAVVCLITGALLDKTFGHLIHRLGQVYNALGVYFLFRANVRNLDDILRLTKIISVIILPLTIALLIEKATGRNIFYIFGGVPEITMIRGGRLRCQGPFAHPIMAGTFGATLMPLFVGLWFSNTKAKFNAFVGFICATIITLVSSASGPVMTYLAGIIGLSVWFFSKYMKAIRWGLLITIITLHFFMKAPIWFLIGRLGFLIGGTGWHRSELIDAAIKHINEWWLIGTTYTAHWLPFSVLINPDMTDITNHYILEGVYGGLPRMLLFITIIVVGFKGIGYSIESLKDESFAIRFMPWTIGTALFAHVVAFISVAYFDQLVVMWYLLLAIISTISNMPHTVTAKMSDS